MVYEEKSLLEMDDDWPITAGSAYCASVGCWLLMVGPGVTRIAWGLEPLRRELLVVMTQPVVCRAIFDIFV